MAENHTDNPQKTGALTLVPDRPKVGAVLVVGGGIAGMQAALDLADSGYFVYLAEKEPAIGGVMPQLDKTFPTNDCSMCILAPRLAECGRHLNVEIIAPSKVAEVAGEAGDFTVKLVQPARYIDLEKCIACGLCAEKCPKKVKDEFNEGLVMRKAAYVRYPQAVPLKYAIDRDNCIFFAKGGKCRACEKFCPTGAVNFDEADREREIKVGAVILAPGFRPFDARLKPEYGYGRYPNVVSALEFERILSPTGSFAGKVLRPSDQKPPRKVAWIQCVGSRDASIGREYCSYACCMFATKQAVIAEEHDPDIKPTIFYIDLRAQGKGFDRYCERAERDSGVRYIRSMVSRVIEDPRTNNLELTYVDAEGRIQSEEFGLVVLSTGFTPHADVADLARAVGIDTNPWGFAQDRPFEMVSTSRPGVFSCGAFQGPKDIPETVAQASAAAAGAARLLAEVRGTLARKEEYPSERDVSREPPRIGVFICHCGVNIAGVIDVVDVAEFAQSLPNVVYSEHGMFLCSTDTLQRMREIIDKEGLNRVVVASCSPRTHEILFQDTLRRASLNKYLFKMANIRDQDSWVHQADPVAATAKAKELVRMSVSRVALQESLYEAPSQVTPRALVLGGGVAGMTAALTVADGGFDVYLVVKEESLGGLAQQMHYTLEGLAIQPLLQDLRRQVEGHPGIQVFLNTQVDCFGGHVGKYYAALHNPVGRTEIDFGAALIATGAVPYQPTEYLYGEHPRVLTQLELENLLVQEPQSLPAEPCVVMIQCVGCREPEHPYCSRVCCSDAVKNAIRLKELNPRARVSILYRDIRTFGFKELYYLKARELGVQFLRFEPDQKPEVAADGERLAVTVRDANLNATLRLSADYLVLSAAIRPHPNTKEFARLFKLPYDADGFFMEAHMKLRPLDFTTDGFFLCGLAHGPKFLEETIAQAQGAASRAMTILTQEQLWVGGPIANVFKDRCAECLTCVRTCPFNVPVIDPKTHKAYIDPAKCQGCGVCVAECPHKAIELLNMKDEQLMTEVLAALG